MRSAGVRAPGDDHERGHAPGRPRRGTARAASGSTPARARPNRRRSRSPARCRAARSASRWSPRSGSRRRVRSPRDAVDAHRGCRARERVHAQFGGPRPRARVAVEHPRRSRRVVGPDEAGVEDRVSGQAAICARARDRDRRGETRTGAVRPYPRSRRTAPVARRERPDLRHRHAGRCRIRAGVAAWLARTGRMRTRTAGEHHHGARSPAP